MLNTLSAGALPLLLGEGTYWIDVALTGVPTGQVFTPPVTIPGQLVTGNALQRSPQDGNYYPMVDAASGQPQQGLPFRIVGTVTTVPEPSALALAGLAAVTAGVVRRRRGGK